MAKMPRGITARATGGSGITLAEAERLIGLVTVAGRPAQFPAPNETHRRILWDGLRVPADVYAFDLGGGQSWAVNVQAHNGGSWWYRCSARQYRANLGQPPAPIPARNGKDRSHA